MGFKIFLNFYLYINNLIIWMETHKPPESYLQFIKANNTDKAILTALSLLQRLVGK